MTDKTDATITEIDSDLLAKFAVRFDKRVYSDAEIDVHNSRIGKLMRALDGIPSEEQFISTVESYILGMPGVELIRSENFSDKLRKLSEEHAPKGKKEAPRFRWARKGEQEQQTSPTEPEVKHGHNCKCMKDYVEMAASDDPVQAATGRFLQKFHPVLIDHGRAEVNREDADPDAFVAGLCRGFVMQMSDIVIQSVRDENDPRQVLRAVRDAIVRDIDHIADHPDLELPFEELKAKANKGNRAH